MGHAAGDELLAIVAKRLEANIRASDLVVRFGGDEFVLILSQTSDRTTAAAIASALISACSQPVALSGGEEVSIGASIGIATLNHGLVDANVLLRNADAALYSAKMAGKGCFRFYSAELTEEANRRLSNESQLKRALDNNEFYLEYQPLTCLETGKIFGAEALTRWHDPVRGLIMPNDFIPLAEETGQIVPLGDWVMRAACRQMRSWLDSGLSLSTMAVNVSARQLRCPRFCDWLLDVLRETSLKPSFLELEISESMLIDIGETSQTNLKALKSLGIRLSIDDFGTGYSSLAYLRRFDIDKVKIDRMFVADIGEQAASHAITAAIIQMGKALELEVLAEGVETEVQRQFLVENHCDTAQGYLFSKPVSSTRFMELVGLPANMRAA